MIDRSCLECQSVKVCSTWKLFRNAIGQVSCEHGNYADRDELYKSIALLVADNCYIYTEKKEME